MTRTAAAPDSARSWLAKVAADVERAESVVGGSPRIASSSPAYCAALVVKGRLSREDEAAGRAFAGPDGEAVRKALAALGVPGEPFLAVTRPTAKANEDLEAAARRICELAHAVEAEIVLALDPVAADDVARAFGLQELKPGEPVDVPGFRLLATNDFAAALADERAKRAVWRQLKALAKGR
ncbi:MAG: hypothetical protein QMD96_08225 [Anaerosomatales bacterium]|nr:hypothetical protein [Anaerosomatales bacterium]